MQRYETKKRAVDNIVVQFTIISTDFSLFTRCSFWGASLNYTFVQLLPQYISERARSAYQFGLALCAAAATLIVYRLAIRTGLQYADYFNIDYYISPDFWLSGTPLYFYLFLLVAGICFLFRTRVTYLILSFFTFSVLAELLLASVTGSEVAFSMLETVILIGCLGAAGYRIVTRWQKSISRRRGQMLAGAIFGILATVCLNILI
jgi:hypothetical protein